MSPAPDTAGVRVLIVDSFDSGLMYSEFLRAYGLTAWRVATPEHAFEWLRASTPDVIVSDMIFARSALDGPAFIRDVRHRRELRNTPVIVVSGLVRVADREAARAAGATTLAIKPCLPGALLGMITDVIEKTRAGEPIAWNWPDDIPDRRRTDRRAS